MSAAQGQDRSADAGCVNLRWSAALLDGLFRGGLRTLVLSPGSRSTPVVLAAQRQAGIDIVPILDERSAAFFALGTAGASGRPVALLATSGSAPAHWYPAVIEASESGLPLILLSADRPPQLRLWGANQTVDQTRLFGAFVRESHDPGHPLDDPKALKALRALGLRAATLGLGPRPGPVHINLPFAEPLVPAGDCEPEPPVWPALPVAAEVTSYQALDSLPAGRGLIVCGPGAFADDFAPTLRRCSEHHGLPVLADPLSGLRFGPESAQVMTGYDALLRNAAAAKALRPDWVLRFGRAPVSKRLGEWLAGVPAILVDPGGGWCDPSHDVRQRLSASPTSVCEALLGLDNRSAGDDWLARWQGAERRVQALADAHLAGSPWCEGHLLRALMARLPAGESLLCANSLPIRQLDSWSGSRAAPLGLFCNRGVSGIDGQLSTLAGLSHGGRPTWALLGDLSFCHDLSGLLQASRLDRPVLVLNNGGGRIFDYLPQHGLPGFEALWRTPVAPNLAALAAPFGLAHRSISDATGLEQALDDALGRGRVAELIEVRIDADQSRAVHQGFWRRVANAPIIKEG